MKLGKIKEWLAALAAAAALLFGSTEFASAKIGPAKVMDLIVHIGPYPAELGHSSNQSFTDRQRIATSRTMLREQVQPGVQGLHPETR